MKTYFKLELERAIFSWRFIISIIIILALLLIPYLKEIHFPFPGLDGVDYYVRITRFSYIGLIGPLVAAFIYSTSIVKDKESGFMNKLLEIIDIKIYFRVKLAVNTLITSIVFAVSHGVLILYFIITLGINNTAVEDIASGAFGNLYNVSKVAYIVLLLLVISISSAAFSIFTLGITTAANNKLTAYIASLFYAIFTGIFFEIWSLNNVIDFNITELFNLTMNLNTRVFSVLLYDLILASIGVLLIYKFGYKRNVPLYMET